jgi:hypothetical protein
MSGWLNMPEQTIKCANCASDKRYVISIVKDWFKHALGIAIHSDKVALQFTEAFCCEDIDAKMSPERKAFLAYTDCFDEDQENEYFIRTMVESIEDRTKRKYERKMRKYKRKMRKMRKYIASIQ